MALKKLGPGFSEKESLLYFGAGLLAFLPNFFIPFVHGDEAGWMSLSRYVFTGDLYRNFTDTKPPFLFEFHWLLSLGESSWVALRILLCGWMIFGGWMFRLILEHTFEQRWAWYGGLVFILMSGLIESCAYTGERAYLPFLFLAVWLSLAVSSRESSRNILYSFALGGCIGAASCIKQPAFVLGGICFFFLLKSKSMISNLFFAFCGGLVAVAVIAGLVQVPLSLIYREIFQQNQAYLAHGGNLKDILTNLGYMLLCYAPLILGSFLGLGAWLKKPVKRWNFNFFLVAVWALLSLITLSLGFRFYQTYYIACLPLLIFLGLYGLISFDKGWGVKALTWSLLVVLFSFHSYTVARQITDRNPAWDTHMRHLISEIRNKTDSSDRIWMLNSTHAAYAMTERRPAVKHIYFHQTLGHLDICHAPASQLVENRDYENYKRLLEDLKTNQPKVVFWTQRHGNTCSDRLKIENFPSIARLLEESYQLLWESPLGKFFMRRDYV